MRDGTAIPDLAALVAPMAAGDFRALLAARRPHHQPGTDAHRFEALLDWQGLVDSVHDGRFPADRVRLTRRERRVSEAAYKADGAVNATAFDTIIAAGASFIASRADRYVPAIGALCAAVAAESGDHVTCGAIASTGPGGALDLHYDEMDLLILQVDGAKRWLIYEDPVPDPVLGMPLVESDPSAQPLLEVVHRAGDWLLLPAGYRHHCETQGDRSLHLAMGLFPLTAPRALDLIMRDMVADRDARRPIRAVGDEAEAALKRRLIERIEAMSLDELVRRHRTTDVKPKLR